MVKIMKLDDLHLANLNLGLSIDRLEREGFTDLDDMKHAWLRINKFLIKVSNISPQESLATAETLLSLDADSDLKPNFCHAVKDLYNAIYYRVLGLMTFAIVLNFYSVILRV
jgi:VanZ family protein